MKKMKTLAFAIIALVGMAGCASAPVADLSRTSAALQAPAEEQKVMRPLPSYGSMGGYRYRRFTATAG